MAQNALVTGAGGFIGSHVVETLLENGWNVTALVRYNSRSSCGWLEPLVRSMPKGFFVVHGDVTDTYQMREIAGGADAIFHLAALIGIPYSYVAPASYVQTNITGTMNLLEAARYHGTSRFIHTSTSEVYGTAIYTPIDEKHPLQGQSPYAASKIAADKLVESYHLSFGMNTVVVRPFNTYGPRQSARAVIPTIITQALKHPVIKLGALEPVRDLTFVTDTAAGFLAAATSDAAVGREVNLGTTDSVSIGELVERIGAIMNMDIEVQQSASRQRPETSEVMKLISDNTLAARIMNWHAQVSLEDGLRRTVDWISQNQDCYRTGEYSR